MKPMAFLHTKASALDLFDSITDDIKATIDTISKLVNNNVAKLEVIKENNKEAKTILNTCSSDIQQIREKMDNLVDDVNDLLKDTEYSHLMITKITD